MTSGMRTVIYPVADLERAKAVFRALLATEPSADTPYYVGFSVDGQDIGLDPNGHARGMTGPVAYCHVTDIAERLAALVAAGAVEHEPVKDVGGGKLVGTVRDPDGNLIGLVQEP